MSRVYVPGGGAIGAKLLILGEAPARNEVTQMKNFVGASGNELNKLLKEINISRESCWITNVSKYEIMLNPAGKKIPFHVRAKNSGIDMEEQLEALQEEINAVNPNCILALGGSALWALTGARRGGKYSIGDYRGSILRGMGKKFVATYHPAHLIHQKGGEFKGYWNRQLMRVDFNRAKCQSQFPELKLPERRLIIARSSANFYDFLERHKGMIHPAVDIEAGGHCIPICISIAFTPKEGITIPLWNTTGISSIPDGDLAHLWKMLAEFLIQHDIIGQNFKYDQNKLKRLGFIIKSLYSDTMLKGFAINCELPKNLAFFTSIYTEEPFYKNEGMYGGEYTEWDGEKLIKKHASLSWKELLEGGARDACVTKEVDMQMDIDLDEIGMRPFYENFLMKLHPAYADIEAEGFCINHEVRDALLHKYIEWSERLSHELFQLVGHELNVNSHGNNGQVPKLLYGAMGLPQRSGTGEEVLTGLLKHCKTAEDRAILEKILEKRRVEKTISTYLLALPDYDGKMRTTFYLCLETGRTGTRQQKEPVRPRVIVEDIFTGKKKRAYFGTSFQVLTKHGDIGQDIRRMYEPEPGYLFVNADSSQAEARVISLLSDDEDMLKRYDTHDIHALTASWFFDGSESDYSKKVLGYECNERFIGKTLRHAGERGAKKRRAATEVNTSARKYKINDSNGNLLAITEGQAEAALNILHRTQPKLHEVYMNGLIEMLKSSRWLTAPLPYGIDAPFGGKRQFFERWGDELFREAASYLPQRAVTDNTKGALIRLRELLPGIRVVSESHDSLTFMIRVNDVDSVTPSIKQEFERPINFSACSFPRHELVVPCEIEVGENYMEFTNYVFPSGNEPNLPKMHIPIVIQPSDEWAPRV